MAKEVCLSEKKEKEEFEKNFQKAIQSANTNFLIGSGCSMPAINILGNVEKDIQKLLEKDEFDKAEEKTFKFLMPFVDSTKQLIDDTSSLDTDHLSTLELYKSFIETLATLLFERKSNILHKQVSIFTTNYDLFIEKATEEFATQIITNDGFQKTKSLTHEYKFSSSQFFNILYSTGNLYNYQVELPAINLIKLHGSLNWQISGKEIVNSYDFLEEAEKLKSTSKSDEKKRFNNLFSVILPKKDKFKETVLNQVYYDLLRIYANELDKENTVLIVIGFSFKDEHILDITKRALKNPTLKIIVFAWEKNPANYAKMFNDFNNVEIVYSKDENIGLEKITKILSEIIPKAFGEEE